MRPAWCAILALALALPVLMPSGAAGPGDVVGSGHIVAGVFSAHPAVFWYLFGGEFGPEETPYQFALPLANLDGQTVEAVVADNTGTGYFVEMAFYDAGMPLEAACEITEESHAILQPPYVIAELTERCVVPPGADKLYVYAHDGIDLDVTVVVV